MLATTTAYIVKQNISTRLGAHEDVMLSIEDDPEMGSFVSKVQVMQERFNRGMEGMEDKDPSDVMDEAKEVMDRNDKAILQQSKDLHEAALLRLQERIDESQSILSEGSELNDLGNATSAAMGAPPVVFFDVAAFFGTTS